MSPRSGSPQPERLLQRRGKKIKFLKFWNQHWFQKINFYFFPLLHEYRGSDPGLGHRENQNHHSGGHVPDCIDTRLKNRLCAKKKSLQAKKIKKTYNTRDSLVVPYQSTDRAQGCLTSQFGWDAVLSPWYDRKTLLLRGFEPPCVQRNHRRK